MDNNFILPNPPFRVRSFGRVRDNPRHFTPGTKQGDIMLILNIDGIGHYRNKKSSITVGPSTVGLIPNDDPGVLYSDPHQPYNHLFCRFQGDYAKSLTQSILNHQGKRFFTVEDVQTLCLDFHLIEHTIRKELPQKMGEHELALAKILVNLAGENSETPSRKATAHSLRQYLENRLDVLVDLEEMAQHFGVSKSSLCRLAKKLLGDTLVNCSHTIRVEQACQLLSMQEMAISDVAERVGFKDPFYFSRIFKSKLGVSPKQWQIEARSTYS